MTYIFINDEGQFLQTKADTWREALVKILKYFTLPENAPENVQCYCIKKSDSIIDGIEMLETFTKCKVLYFNWDEKYSINRLFELK